MKVSVSGPLRDAMDGADSVNVEAATILELLTKLQDWYPGLEQFKEDGIAVAINGTIYRDSWHTPIPEGAEVFVMPRIVGG